MVNKEMETNYVIHRKLPLKSLTLNITNISFIKHTHKVANYFHLLNAYVCQALWLSVYLLCY